ncbi:MAG: type II toxin-antitoxin system PemK/MazF family toxin [Bacteroidota bacterium]|jgi:mRNA interferase MazF
MPAAGHIAYVQLPNADLSQGKNRPVLVIGKCPGKFDDWLICPVSSRQYQATPGVDELVNPGDADYPATGLIVPSVIRVCRLAVVESSLLIGAIGAVDPARLKRVKANLMNWISNL